MENILGCREREELLSHHEILTFWREKLSVAFIVEHFLQNSRLGAPSPKILEIGAWPIKNIFVAAEYDNTAVALLAQNKNMKVAGVDNIDKLAVYGYDRYPNPYFGNGIFVNGDFNIASTQQSLVTALGGKPHVIIGNWVFETELGK